MCEVARLCLSHFFFSFFTVREVRIKEIRCGRFVVHAELNILGFYIRQLRRLENEKIDFFVFTAGEVRIKEIRCSGFVVHPKLDILGFYIWQHRRLENRENRVFPDQWMSRFS